MNIKTLLSTLLLFSAWPSVAPLAEELNYNPLNPFSGKNAFTEERQTRYEEISKKRGEFKRYAKFCKSVDELERPWESMQAGLNRIDLSTQIIRQAKIASKSRLSTFKQAEKVGEDIGKDTVQNFQGSPEEKLEFCRDRINEYQEFGKQNSSLIAIFLPEFRDEGDLILFPNTRYYELTEEEYTTLQEAMTPYGEFLEYTKFCKNLEQPNPDLRSIELGLPYMKTSLNNVKYSRAIDKTAFATLKDLREQGEEAAKLQLNAIGQGEEASFCEAVVQDYSDYSQTYSPLLIQVNAKTYAIAQAVLASRVNVFDVLFPVVDNFASPAASPSVRLNPVGRGSFGTGANAAIRVLGSPTGCDHFGRDSLGFNSGC